MYLYILDSEELALIREYIKNIEVRDNLAKTLFKNDKAYASFVLLNILNNEGENEITIEIDVNNTSVYSLYPLFLITTGWTDTSSQYNLIEFRLYNKIEYNLDSFTLLLDDSGNVTHHVADSFWDNTYWNII